MEVEGLTMSCQELVELVTEYLEGALPDERHARFVQHLATCSACATHLAQMRDTVRLTGALRPSDVSPEALAVLQGAFAGWKARKK